MRIIYFTTACEKEDYIAFCRSWTLSLNTTIQRLHNRLIRSLALTHEVDVISVRPFSKKHCDLKRLRASTTQEGKITWHYLEIKRNRILRFVSAKRQADRLLKKMNLKDSIILTDTLNPYLLNSSTSLAKKYHLPIIGVCNNTPSGINNTGKSYTMFLLSMADDLSGYITLTSGLNVLFNEHNRANLTFEGVLENRFKESDVSEYGKYIFYNGNLETKFGIYDLIDAFKELSVPDLKLIISGYHEDEKKLEKAIQDNESIINLGMIDVDLVLSLENGSVANISPRPYTEDFDRYLIPNHLVDYLGSKSITISVKNSKMQPLFPDCAIWVDSSDKEDLISGIKKALAISDKNRLAMIKKANSEANKQYSMGVINRKLVLFLRQFLKTKD